MDPGGKLWSIPIGASVPAYQHDFGCRDALIGGALAPEKGPARPRWRVCRFSQAEPSLGPIPTTGVRYGEAEEVHVRTIA